MSFKLSNIIQPFVGLMRGIIALFGVFNYGSGIKYGEEGAEKTGTFTPTEKEMPGTISPKDKILPYKKA